MSEFKNDIDQLFYEGIEAHREYPAPNVWKDVETELDKEVITVYKRKYGKLKKGFGLLLLLFMGFLVYDIFGTYVFDATVKQGIAPVVENAGKPEQITSGTDKPASQLPVKSGTETNTVREAETTGNNIQHKVTVVTPGNNNHQHTISSVTDEKKAVAKNRVSQTKDQSTPVITQVDPAAGATRV